MKKDSFIIVIPVYNEEKCIDIVLNSWSNLTKKYPDSEILVINDGSKDQTKEKLKQLGEEITGLKVIHKINEGHGATVLKGYKEAIKSNHNWIFQTDSDDQFNPQDFEKLWAKRDSSNFILGHRLKRKDPLHRLVLTKIICLFNKIIFGVSINDANIPYRLIKKDYLKSMLEILPKNLFAPNIFLSILAKKDGQNLMNIPVTHKIRKTGKISIVKLNLIKACFRGLKELILFKLKLPFILSELDKEKSFIKKNEAI